MALHNRDKETRDNSNPTVDAHDNTTESRMAHGTSSIHPVTDATTSSAYVQTKNGRVLINDGIYNRVIIGLFPSGQIGIIVSNPGVDVLSLF